MNKQYPITGKELRELLKSTIKVAVDENDPIINDSIFAFKLSKTPISKVGKEKEIREIIENNITIPVVESGFNKDGQKYTVQLGKELNYDEAIKQLSQLAKPSGEAAQDKLTVKELIAAKELIEKAKVRIDFVIDRHEKPKAISQLQPSGEVIAESVITDVWYLREFNHLVFELYIDECLRIYDTEDNRFPNKGEKYKLIIHKCKESK